MTVRVRRMRWWDVDEIVGVEHEVFREDPWSAAGFWSELAGVPATRYYVVAELEPGSDDGSHERSDDGSDGRRLVGYGGLMVSGPEADIQTVAVRPDRRGTGLGETLATYLVEEALRRRCTRIMLEVREGNDPARRLYERLGFEADGRRADYYGPGGDAIVMRRLLERPPS